MRVNYKEEIKIREKKINELVEIIKKQEEKIKELAVLKIKNDFKNKYHKLKDK